MSLSKKNLDKLNTYIQNKNLSSDINIDDSLTTKNIHAKSKSSLKSNDPNDIFYSLIDNSETLNETSQVNHLLRNSEKDSDSINCEEIHYSNNLSTEDELYDEFNYLLEE